MTKEELQSELGTLRRQLAWALYDRHVALTSKERELASARIAAIEAQRNKVVERLVECERLTWPTITDGEIFSLGGDIK